MSLREHKNQDFAAAADPSNRDFCPNRDAERLTYPLAIPVNSFEACALGFAVASCCVGSFSSSKFLLALLVVLFTLPAA
jgi:hypothetical protein